MAASADYRVMATGAARIGVPELVVGVPFPRLPLEIVAARLSPAVLRTLIYSGRTVHAEEAVVVGFIDEAAEPDHVVRRGLAVAEQLSAIPARNFALTKRAFTESVLERVRVSADSDAEVGAAWQSPEVHAAIRRYLDKTIKSGRSTSSAAATKSE
jgi:enoyl-CoA hydratase